MDIIKLLPENLPPLFSFQTSELGELYCFTLRVKDWKRLAGKQKESLNDSDWVRALISVSCNKEESLKDGQFKQDDCALSDDEVASLKDCELEDFSLNYVANVPFLKKYKNNEKQKKTDDESHTTYLRRIYNHHNSNLATTKMSKEIEKTILGSRSAFEALSQFKSLASAARATDILSASTLESIAKLREQENAITKKWMPPVPPPPQIFPAQEAVSHLEDLKNLMVASNNVQECISKDITNAISDSRTVSKFNIWISSGVLILTITGLVLAYWTAQTNSEQMDKFMSQMGVNTAAVVKPLEGLSTSVGTSNELNQNLATAIESLGGEVQRLREEQKDQNTIQKSEAGLEKPVQKVQ